MGADLVIAVDPNADLLGRHLKPKSTKATDKRIATEPETWPTQ